MSQPAELPNAIQTPSTFTFLPEQLTLLQDHVDDVKNSGSKKERHRLIKSIRKDVLALPVSVGLPLEQRRNLKHAVDTWFSLRTKHRSNKIKFGKTWTGRLVMYSENKERVNALKTKLYEKDNRKGQGSMNSFNYFQKAVSKIWDELEEEEHRRYVKIARQWNKDGVTREQKQQAAGKKAVEYTKKFAEDMYKSFGVRYLFFMALETPAETINTGLLDFNDCIAGGKSYTVEHPHWEKEGIDMDTWNEHNRCYYDPTKIPGEVMARKAPRVHTELSQNEYGEPLLPNPLIVPHQQNARTWRQNLVRSFLSRHYELASGSSRAIPWKKFVPRARECINDIYLPEEHLRTLAEPSSMRDNECYTLLRFWYQRQTDQQSPTFRFAFYLSQDALVQAKERELVELVPDIPTITAPTADKSINHTKAKTKKHQRKKAPSTSRPDPRGKGKKKASVQDDSSITDSSDSSLLPSSDDSDADSNNLDDLDDTAARDSSPWEFSPITDQVGPFSPRGDNAISSTSQKPMSVDLPMHATISSEIKSSLTPGPTLSFPDSEQPHSSESEEETEDVSLPPEIQQLIMDKLAGGDVDLTATFVATLERLRVASTPSPTKSTAPRKRQLTSPETMPSSPTKKSKALLVAIPNTDDSKEHASQSHSVRNPFAGQKSIDISAGDIISTIKDSPASLNNPTVPLKTANKLGAVKTRIAKVKLEPATVTTPRGTRSQTKHAQQSLRRSTRANPT